ncbi:hypothetical protein [Paenibacillus spongiae]|uniref:DUF4436 domain-containing protein n=1 Tax=Paenibacillus spongiae TaxID=2909671 RepID=A0ABY5SFV5_9BACL|nr:hypothetical protein [Paenibacillus spongiae]UVI32821.1 hypothetical protein L1F29_13735 [Paenibacillus spongiae]
MSWVWIRRLVLTLTALFMLQPIIVSANGGPLVDPAGGYGLLQLDDQSNISLIREQVTFDIGQGVTPYEREAEVSVLYELHNTNDSPHTVAIIFLTPAQGELTVTEGSKPVPTAEVDDPRLVNWAPGMKAAVTEPISGKPLRMANNSSGQEAAGNRFTLTFGPGETKSITIRYGDRGGMYDKGVINTIYSHLYYLSPAKFWEGEPLVELEVRLPDSGNRLHSNLLLEKADDVTYRATLKQLPEEEWYFSFADSSRILFPTNREKDHNLMVLGTSFVGAILAAGAALFFRKSSFFLVSAPFILLFTVYYITKMGGYPFNDIFVAMTDVVVGSCLLLCYMWIRRRNSRLLRKNAEEIPT